MKIETLEKEVDEYLYITKDLKPSDIQSKEILFNPKFKGRPTEIGYKVVLKNNPNQKFIYFISKDDELVEEVHKND
jgi:hypothetical protein